MPPGPQHRSISAVPGFLGLAAHPVRWALLGELAHSDRTAGELIDAVGEPQPLVSYHLGRLRAGGLVSSHRSSFDGRAAYYRLHLDRCADGLAATGRALHPALVAPPSIAPPPIDAAPPTVHGTTAPRADVLFACTGNGTRSQIAEALLRDRIGGAMAVASAGSHPKPVHPCAVEVLAERGIDISGASSKHLSTFEGRCFTHVVTLCDRVREVCPEVAGAVRTVHWSTDDPGRRAGSARAVLPAFRATADDLASRIEHLVALVEDDLAVHARPAPARAAKSRNTTTTTTSPSRTGAHHHGT